MKIYVHEQTKTFHLQNEALSYVMGVLPAGGLAQLYFGKRIHDREDFGYLLEEAVRGHSAYLPAPEGHFYSPEHIRQEYPSFGSGDFRHGAVETLQENGSRLSAFAYEGYDILDGKPVLEGLPATYTEQKGEAETLVLHMRDRLTGVCVDLLYTIFADRAVVARSAKFVNRGDQTIQLTRAMSLCLDLPDCDYDWIQFSGSWSRERMPVTRRLQTGETKIESLRGHSSHQENPFVILKRPGTDEFEGEAIGLSLVYSGNFEISAQVDTYDVTRILMGINPTWFSWKLESGASFQTPEALIAYSSEGLNALSQTLHDLYRQRLARGEWRDRPRPILLNNWEATYFDFNEEKLLAIAAGAKESGVELFVLDDGWFGARRDDHAGLGDWYAAPALLPDGIAGIAEKVEALGMKFGLWIEPEMVNPDSDLYRAHPDWCLHVPGRHRSLSRNQLVLDFSRKEVVDCIFGMLCNVLRGAKVSYIKWDMNRSVTECFSEAYGPDRQGEIFHRHILGIYDLYERLIGEFPHILFESCAGGGGRFDAGMLYYAPQAWTSDNTDAVDRLRIQYGTSYGYPLVSMGSHVSAVPNHQVNRITPLRTRAETAFFGTYGYELDLNRLSESEKEEVRSYTAFMKEHRELIQFGDFYRLRSPFDGNEAAWMVVNREKTEALVGLYRTLSKSNIGFGRLRLAGLDPDLQYEVEGSGSFWGDELMNAGLVTSDMCSGRPDFFGNWPYDFASRLFVLKANPGD